jgi:hypothetical protein
MTTTMIDGSIPQWRFETIDARAGLAFAVWRPERTADEWAPPDHAPCLFFAPPAFQPEPVANVAIAMSAARGLFDAGLYIGGREAFFQRPEEVGEFLRRAYVGSGGGDGGDGGAEGPAPVPPPPEPSRPDGRGDGEYRSNEFTRYLVLSIEGFRKSSDQTAFGLSVPSAPGARTLALPEAYAAHSDQALLSGALHVLLELLRRAPPLDRLDDAALNADLLAAGLRWQRDARALGSYIARLGLTNLLLESYGARIEQAFMAGPLHAYLSQDMRDTEDKEFGAAWRYHLVFVDGPLLDGRDALESYRDRTWHVWWHFSFPYPSTTWEHPLHVDAVEFLQKMPLPPAVSACLAADIGEGSSVYHLLCVLLGQPISLAVARAPLDKALDIAVFGAACITTLPGHIARTAARGRFSERPPESERAQLKQVAARAAGWLIEHLPERLFAPGYEEFLGRTKNIRYHSALSAP